MEKIEREDYTHTESTPPECEYRQQSMEEEMLDYIITSNRRILLLTFLM